MAHLFLATIKSASEISRKKGQAPSGNWLALGDSYTIGELVSFEERWPIQLNALLRKENLHYKHPFFIAQTGWTTWELREAINQENLKEPFDLVSLLIGVNDQYRGYDTQHYEKEFKLLLEIALKSGGNDPNKLMVLSIPDYSVTPFAADKNPAKIAREIAAYNEINYRQTMEAGAHYFNITPISQKAGHDWSLIASDELHPSGKMYGLWAEHVYSAWKMD